MTTPDQFPDAGDMVPTVVAFLDAQGHPRHVKFVPSANDRRHCAPFRPLITQEAHELFVAALMVRLEAAERLAADRLEQMQADRKQALVWRDQAELYEQVRKFSPREFQALWTKNVTSGAMFDDLVRAAIASEAKT